MYTIVQQSEEILTWHEGKELTKQLLPNTPINRNFSKCIYLDGG